MSSPVSSAPSRIVRPRASHRCPLRRRLHRPPDDPPPRGRPAADAQERRWRLDLARRWVIGQAPELRMTAHGSLWSADFVASSDDLDKVEQCVAEFGSHRFAFTGPATLRHQDSELSGMEGISLFVQADGSMGARNQGLHLARRLYEAAGVDPARIRIIGVLPVHDGDDRTNELMEVANALIEEGRPELAVVAAQTACEITLRNTFWTVLAGDRENGQLVLNLVQKFALMEPGSKQLFEHVFGVRPASHSWWPEYVAHVARRNQVVHKGAVVAESEARKSVEVAEQVLRTVRHWSLGLSESP